MAQTAPSLRLKSGDDVVKWGSVLLALAVGSVVGFWGVLLSVFSDGPWSERLVVIAIVLALYVILTAVWTFFSPQRLWLWLIILGLPGILLLAVYMWHDFKSFYILYMVLIVTAAYLGAQGGAKLKKIQLKK
jgi:hypothetical protein